MPFEIKDVQTLDRVIDQVEKNSTPERSSKTSNKIDWLVFWHLLTSWLLCGLVICCVLIILAMSEESEHIFKDVLMKTDTISLMFSLVLSAFLEQVWNNRDEFRYKITQMTEFFISIIGLGLYLAYSMWDIYHPDNMYHQFRYEITLVYIIISIIGVIVGFLMRSQKTE